jgi:hypothetical protein
VASLFDRALAGANLAPMAGDDPARAWVAERARRWAALGAWFAPADGSEPRIAGLLVVARTAIVELLRVRERRWDSRRRSASIAHDFRRLADWFAAAPGEEEAHRQLADERSVAIRTLLAAPLLDSNADPIGFRLVARHQAWLVEWFESSCGWRLKVDAAAGFARLAKRAADPDPSRPELLADMVG